MMGHHAHDEPLDNVIDALREQGERITLQRRMVIEVLHAAQNHMTLQQVCAQVRHNNPQAGLSETTIYRILQWLKDVGIIAQTDLGQSGVTYAWLSSPTHHHLLCLHCGRMMQIDDDCLQPLRQQLHAAYGFEARIDHMAIYGVCDNCR